MKEIREMINRKDMVNLESPGRSWALPGMETQKRGPYGQKPGPEGQQGRKREDHRAGVLAARMRFAAAAAAAAMAAGVLAAPVGAAPITAPPSAPASEGSASITAAPTAAAPAGAVPVYGAGVPSGVSSLRAAREINSQTMNSVWLLPDSDTYYISESDVSWMDDEELMLARNEFYARRGRKFVTRSIQEYFNRQGWYRGYIDPEDFSTDLFNRYEQANVDFIVAYENKRKELREQEARRQRKEKQLDGYNPTAEAGTGEYGALYGEITSLYQDALAQDWSGEELAIAGMNGLAADLESPAELGYACRDLDGDGIGELLIAPVDTREYGQGAVFEIYTIQDGIPVLVASSDAHTSYYICEDNTICREQTMAEGGWELDYLDLKAGDLVCKDILLMDEGKDAEDPWFVISGAGAFAQDEDGGLVGVTQEDYDAVSYEDASNLRASYAADSLELVPLGE